ncbi:hypothetical protein ARMSODRAFT_1023668 [Armillaria solidipes]|uniref:F-box domain-containing protein n=1 Tax=Armillaria solidipes TaxID=1076256 RepID=A0A2H3B219_9AGAR|nr:hypothetical protein ARMSODRAFT_1023668 [Armillaria solidipes]
MAILPNVDKLAFQRVRLITDTDWSTLPGVRHLELVHCWLRFSVLDSLLASLPNLIRLGIHGEHTFFLPTVPDVAETEPSLQNIAPMLSCLHLDLRAALNGDHGGQWLLTPPNLTRLELGMTEERGCWSGLDILDNSVSTLRVLDLALNHRSAFWDVDLNLYTCVTLEYLTLSLAITEDGGELYYLRQALGGLGSHQLQSLNLQLHWLSGPLEFRVLSDITQALADIDDHIIRLFGGMVGQQVCIHLHFYLRMGQDKTVRALWVPFQGLREDKGIVFTSAVMHHEYVMDM